MRTFAILTLGVLVGIGGLTSAGHDTPSKNKLKTVLDRDVVEKLDGQAAHVTAVEITIEPGQGSKPHRHPGPVFGYVLEGEYEWGLNDQPVKLLKVGDTFYEPTGSLHRVSRNPSKKQRTRLLAVMVHPRSARQLVLPAEKK